LRVTVRQSWYDGTDACFVDSQTKKGIICASDFALIELSPQDGSYPGASTGWLGFGHGGWGFTSDKKILVTQLGYPTCLDYGEQMQVTNSQGYTSTSASNTIIGSLMCGGSSGGPWIANFGQRPVLNSQTSGWFPESNIVIGVTSWGSSDNKVKYAGASPLSVNFKSLYDWFCGSSKSCR
jgi:hypothetical protein